MLKKTDQFVWSSAADQAFEDLKRQLANPPVLVAPIDKEPLLLYVAANARAVSVAIVVERKEAGKEHPVQRPVYYISEVLIESKQRYPHWQKLVYGVFMASRKLKQYFLGHPITVVSSAPLGDIIQNWKRLAGLPSGLRAWATRIEIRASDGGQVASTCRFHQ